MGKRYRKDKGMMKGSETDMLYKGQGGRNRENNDNRMDEYKEWEKNMGEIRKGKKGTEGIKRRNLVMENI